MGFSLFVNAAMRFLMSVDMILVRLLLGTFFCGLSINRCTSQPVKTEDGSQWNHNGSMMTLLVKGSHREFIFSNPREGLRSEGVRAGTKAFSGTMKGDEYQGTAYVFSKTCGVFGFQMRGTASADQQRVTMSGRAPYVDAQCRILGYHDAVYEFTLVVEPGPAQAQEGPGQNEYFGEDGKLYFVEKSETEETDVIKYYLLYRRPISGEDGFFL
jgi:hypothetical protein